MPNDAKTKLDRATHLLQDQPTTANPVGASQSGKSGEAAERQPPQAQQRDTAGTTLVPPDETAAEGKEEPGRV